MHFLERQPLEGDAGRAINRTFVIASTVFEKLPLDSANGLASAKSHVIGRACLLKVLTTNSFFGELLHVQSVECDSANFSTTKERYTPIASEYAFAPLPHLQGCVHRLEGRSLMHLDMLFPVPNNQIAKCCHGY